MKKVFNLLIFTSLLFISSCNSLSGSNNSNNNNSKENTNENESNDTNLDDNPTDKYSDDHLSRLKNKYGELKIEREDGNEVNYSFDESKNEYVIKVEENKAKYVISGYTEAHFVISNPNNLTTYKGIKIKLSNACIVSKNEYVPIYYSLDSKNIELSAKNDTSNWIMAFNGTNAFDSENNIELGGKGKLDIYTKSTGGDGSNGHCVKSSNKVTIYDSLSLSLTSAHDGIHCDEFYTYNESDNTNYTGVINFNSIGSQAIEASTKRCNGIINLSGGKYLIDNAVNIFKVDKELTVASGVEVKATNIKNKPIIKQSNDEVEAGTTIPVLNIVVEGTFISNGNNIKTQKL